MPAYLGQHFLVDDGVARAIAEALEITVQDTVVEIGPGQGILTRQLIGRAGRLVAVELDQDLIAFLRREFQESERFRIVHGDFLKVDLDALVGPSPPSGRGGAMESPSPRSRGEGGGEGIKFVGNLPYAVASPILQKVLAWPQASLAVFMFQKEVCDRLTAGPGSRDYGVLSIVAGLYAEVSRIAEVGREKFRPRPRVDSGVLGFRMRPRPLPQGVTAAALLKVAKAAFSQRRKQIVNPLARGLGRPKADILKALESCGIAPEARAEQVSLEGFAALAREFAGRAQP